MSNEEQTTREHQHWLMQTAATNIVNLRLEQLGRKVWGPSEQWAQKGITDILMSLDNDLAKRVEADTFSSQPFDQETKSILQAGVEALNKQEPPKAP